MKGGGQRVVGVQNKHGASAHRPAMRRRRTRGIAGAGRGRVQTANGWGGYARKVWRAYCSSDSMTTASHLTLPGAGAQQHGGYALGLVLEPSRFNHLKTASRARRQAVRRWRFAVGAGDRDYFAFRQGGRMSGPILSASPPGSELPLSACRPPRACRLLAFSFLTAVIPPIPSRTLEISLLICAASACGPLKLYLGAHSRSL